MPQNSAPPSEHRHPVLRWIGRAFGVLYILGTLLFGPIKWLAVWLGRQSFIQNYKAGIAALPPVLGLAVSVLSLGLLEISKIAVLLTYERHGVVAAVLATIAAKASLGYLAHTTWHAARPKVIAVYPWAARADAWVAQQIARIKGYRDHALAAIKASFWYPAVVQAFGVLRPAAVGAVAAVKKLCANLFGQKT